MKQAYNANIYESDRLKTIENKKKLEKNTNLLYWYRLLYIALLQDVPDIKNKIILEIGSGTSPLKTNIPNVITSDVMKLDYLDHCFDAHNIDQYNKIQDDSLDVITVTNVLHHLKKPIDFLINSKQKLKPGGRIIILEPFFSAISTLVYTYIHREPVDFHTKKPELSDAEGPLFSANIALPYLIFFSKNNWDAALRLHYRISSEEYHTSLSYMCTGGISNKIPIPFLLYRLIYKIDYWLARVMPKIFASFFIISLTKKDN